MRKGLNFRIFSFLLLSAFIISDRAAKAYFLANSESTFNLFGDGALLLHFVKNKGIAFSLSLASPLVIVLTLVALAFVIFTLRRSFEKNERYMTLGLCSILLGAFSNFFDRLKYGYVIDYIDVRFFSVFNIADAMITAGIILVFLEELYNNKMKKKILS